MNTKQVKPEPLSRTALVDALRSELTRRAGDTSICMYAARAGLFCKGFRRYSDSELKRRYGWIARKQRDASREQLEEIADRWQLARQEVLDVPSSCDVQQLERDVCGGWDDFSNEDLVRFFRELTGRNIQVTS